MYNAAASIRNIRALSKHEEQLDRLVENYRDYVQKLFAIRTKRNAQEFADEIAPMISLLHRWNFDPIRYRCIRGKLEYVRKLKKGLDERATQLNLGEIEGVDLRKIYPTLAELAEEYSQELSVSVKKNGKNGRQKTKKEPAEDWPETENIPEEERGVEDKVRGVPLHQKAGYLPGGEETPGEEEGKPKAQPLELIAAAAAIDLRDVNEFFEYYGLVGEKDTSLVTAVSAQKLLSFGYVSLSGTGKSKCTYILIDMFPDGTMYIMELSSETAESYEAEEINKHRIIFIPELQKAFESGNKLVKELLKNVTEGRDGVRKVRNQSKGINEEYRTKGDLGVIFAMTPEHKYDSEFSRRVFVLQTDISPEQTRRVINHIAGQAHANGGRRTKRFAKLRDHMGNCLDLNGKIEYDVPCAEYIAGFIPDRTVRARSYANYLFDVINACAQFHHGDRVFSDNILFANLIDTHLIMEKLFWKHYMKGLLGIPVAGEETLRIFQESQEGITANDVYTKLNDINCDINEKVSDSILGSLVRAGFLYKDKKRGNGGTKYFMRRAPPNLQLQGFSMQECLKTSLDYLTANYGKRIRSEWLDSQVTQGNKIFSYDPFGGDDVLLVELK